MPLKIVRNDITKMETDAIVNTANPRPQVGDGVDSRIYEAAGFEQLFTDDRYMKVSRHCMDMAKKLADGFASRGYSFAFEAETNQLFPILPDKKAEELAKEFAFTPWGRVDENHQIFRFVTSFMTKPESVDRLIEML